MGEVGHLTREHGMYVNSAFRRPLRAVMRDSARYERAAREVSNGRFGADELLPIARRMSDQSDVVRSIKGMRASLTSWDQIVSAISGGKHLEYGFRKASGTASVWHFDFRSVGWPGAGAYTNIPGGTAFNGLSEGSYGTRGVSLGASDHLYLSNIGVGGEISTLASSGIYITVDLLVGAGDISATSITSQAISTTALPRWTTGEGLCMSLEVTTALGATASNITLTYTDQAGNAANSTGAIALTTGAVAQRLVPAQDGPMIRLADGDSGVRNVEACILSASMLAGVMAAIIYKPIRVSTIFAGLPTEQTTPGQAGGIRRLTDTAGGSMPCITAIRWHAPGMGIAGYYEYVWG